MSQWIWRYGEFECYHNMILHTRRQQYGYPEPVVWKLYAPGTGGLLQKRSDRQKEDISGSSVGKYFGHCRSRAMESEEIRAD